jgi:hypothetical protein
MNFVTKTLNSVIKTLSFSNTQNRGRLGAALLLTFAAVLLPLHAVAQDDQDQQQDPPSRVARLGYVEGSVSFQPAGESEWVQAVPNRPMTTGDKLWADNNSRAELQLGSAVIRLSANTGFSFLNLDDRTAQLQITSGALNINVRRLDRDDVFEVDTPNQAFSIFQSGSYRIEASEDGTYTVVSVRQGEGEATGNGQNFTVHAGQRATFSGSDRLRADIVQIGGPDSFDNWAYSRDHRHESSRSAQYVSHDVVGYDDLDDYGDWRDNSEYGHVWFPNRVSAGWAPYHDGHWDWISPWGWTWVDDSSWGYAPFHYGRWVDIDDRWGWVAGPVAVRAVYAPALVVFIGGGGGGGFGANIGWFPLGPREVYVPSYHVSREYVNRVNISNTTVNNTTITNVYNTTIINNKTTNITNVNYANRNVRGAVTAVPQQAFASAQPVNRAAVTVNARDIASAPVSARVAVTPTQQSVFGARAATANRVAAPPTAVANRQVIAKAPPPPAPVAFSKQQQALAQHPGEPLARREVQNLRPANAPATQPMVKQAPPGKPATPNMGSQAADPANRDRPGQPANQPANPTTNQPSNRPAPALPEAKQPQTTNPPAPSARNDRPPAAQPNRPEPTPPQPNRPEPPRPEAKRPQTTNPPAPPARNDRPPAAQPNRPEPTPPQPNRPEAARPEAPRPEADRPAQPPQQDRRQPERPQPDKPQAERPQAERPQPARPQTDRPAQPNNPPPPRAEAPRNEKRPRTPEEEKRQQEEQKKRQQEEQKKPPGI